MTITPNEMNNFYTAPIVHLLDFSLYIPKSISDANVSREAGAYAFLLQFAESSSVARANAAVGFEAGKFDAQLYSRVTAFVAKQEAFGKLLSLNSSNAERNLFEATYTGTPVEETKRMLGIMADAGPGGSVASVTTKSDESSRP